MRKIILGTKTNCDYRKTCYGIARCNGKYLLAYNEKINEYSLPGGGVECGEALEECIQREFIEETGFKVLNIAEFINIDCFWTKRDGKCMETDANFLLVTVDVLNSIPPTDFGHKPIWVDKETLFQCIDFPYQIKALEIFFNEFDKIDFKFN